MIHLLPMRWRLSFILLIFVPPLHANPLFSGFTADYEVSKNGTILGESHRRLISREHGKILNYASTTIPTGIISLFVSDKFMEHSVVEISKNTILPKKYEYQRTGGKKEITFKATFDWRKKRIQMTGHNSPEELKPDTHDLLSFQLALMKGLMNGQRSFQFQVVDHKRIQTQTLKYTRQEKVKTSMGILNVLQLDHRAEKSQYHFTFWCAQELHYLPIKITKTEQDGDIIQLKLKRFNKTRLDFNGDSNGNH